MFFAYILSYIFANYRHCLQQRRDRTKGAMMSIQKESLQEANRALAKYADSNYLNSYVGEFSENEPVSLALDGNFELTELIDIISIAQRFNLVNGNTG